MRSTARKSQSVGRVAGRNTPPMPERKTARIELRVTPSSKQLIDRAISLSGLAAGDLAYEAARRVLEDHGRFILEDADRDVFVQAITHPPQPTARLITALQRHRRATR